MEAAKVLNAVFSNKYSIWLDDDFLADHGDFYPQAFFTNLVFELTLAPPSRIVKGSDASKLVYKLTKIQLQYETICSKTLADEAPACTPAIRHSLMIMFCEKRWSPSQRKPTAH